ncbi:unnamed protein product [Psylliodes chrysocephalus]|uniref:Major facilitator superfamily (MFS) profile domain-containing protein n=1 Tax=Psylliodes chrysocephalus TaxID=3402493 RepID=A0A9P0CNV6_9CUCU|nr:unnamed protein product [Psylliodes chrysocephala]
MSIIVTSMSIGFLQATLEPHLRSFFLPPIILGLMFIINGGIYAMTAPGFGWLCDRAYSPKWITVSGCFLVAAGFCMIGPAPVIPVEKTLWLIMLGLVLHGLGMAAQLVASFTDALRTTVAQGFPNNLETFGLISGLWTSTFALGAFMGPSISGVLFDTIGFPNASLFIIVLHLLVGILTATYIFVAKPQSPYVEIKEETKEEIDKHSYIASLIQNSVTESMKSIRSVGNGISIEKSRPPGMNSLIACNSYKSQAWPERDSSNLNLGPYSYSYGYGTVNRKPSNGGCSSGSYFPIA